MGSTLRKQRHNTELGGALKESMLSTIAFPGYGSRALQASPHRR